MDTPPNEVFLDDDSNIITIKVIGDQTAATVIAMGNDVYKLIDKQRAAGKPVLVLDVLLQIGQVPPEAREQVVAIAKKADYDKAAMLGKGAVLRLGANLILRAVGKGNKVKYFENYDAAIIWLKS
jgi:hypothetical protein